MSHQIFRNQYHPTRAAALSSGYVDLCRGLIKSGSLNQSKLQEFASDLVQLYTEELSRVSVELRPKTADLIKARIESGMYLSGLYHKGMNIYSISESVRDSLKTTTLSGIRLGDLKFPYDSFYVGFERGSGISLDGDILEVDGAYVTKVSSEGDDVAITINLSTRNLEMDTEVRPWLITEERFYTFRISGRADDTFEDALGFAIDSNEFGLEVDQDEIDEFKSSVIEVQPEFSKMGIEVTTPEETGTERDARLKAEGLEPAKKALALVLGSICALSAEPDDLNSNEGWTDDAPNGLVIQAMESKSRKRRQLARGRLLKAGYLPIRKIDLGQPSEEYSKSIGSGGSKKGAHWRAGHFRRQLHGKGLSLVKIIWILPTLVNRDQRPANEGRVYAVKDSSLDSGPKP